MAARAGILQRMTHYLTLKGFSKYVMEYSPFTCKRTTLTTLDKTNQNIVVTLNIQFSNPQRRLVVAEVMVGGVQCLRADGCWGDAVFDRLLYLLSDGSRKMAWVLWDFDDIGFPFWGKPSYMSLR